MKGLPHAVISIINKSLAFDPAMRYPNYDPLIADLAAVKDADAVLLQRTGRQLRMVNQQRIMFGAE